MIHIPSEIRIEATLQVGAVYYFTDGDLSSDEPHYFVVINNPESSESVLLLLVGTSQIEKRERFVNSRGLPSSTLVRIQAGTLDCFTKETIFDCNRVFNKTKIDLVKKLDGGELKIKCTDCLDVTIVQAMVAGVLASPLIEERYKNILR